MAYQLKFHCRVNTKKRTGLTSAFPLTIHYTRGGFTPVHAWPTGPLQPPRYLSVWTDNISLMSDRDITEDSTEVATCCVTPGTGGTDWLVPVSLALTAVFAVNICIVWYLLVAIPSGCADLAARSNGSETCGIQPGAYVISGISIAIIVIALYAFVRWNLTRCRSRKPE